MSTSPSRETRIAGREPRPERREPTHTLIVEVPLHIGEGATFYFDPVQDAVRTILPLTRLASIGALCDGVQVSIREPLDEDAHGPFDPDELVRWAETYGHPESWAKRAQQLHAENERLTAEGRPR